MSSFVLKNILLPFFGTALGSACVFFMKKEMNEKLEKSLLGFASGVMIAASIWSLILPSIEKSSHLGVFSFFPSLIGLWLGLVLMLIIDKFLPEPTPIQNNPQNKTSMLFIAVTLHNLPEGMAVGAVLASLISGNYEVNPATVFALSIGIAIQNFPEGSILSMPMATNGMKKHKAFLYGTLSGIVEPIGAIVTIVFSAFVTPALPYVMSFAAGAMLFVTINELIPNMLCNKKSLSGTLMFSVGFSIMMCLDVALG